MSSVWSFSPVHTFLNVAMVRLSATAVSMMIIISFFSELSVNACSAFISELQCNLLQHHNLTVFFKSYLLRYITGDTLGAFFRALDRLDADCLWMSYLPQLYFSYSPLHRWLVSVLNHILDMLCIDYCTENHS